MRKAEEPSALRGSRCAAHGDVAYHGVDPFNPADITEVAAHGAQAPQAAVGNAVSRDDAEPLAGRPGLLSRGHDTIRRRP
jgi:hypothetical protein